MTPADTSRRIRPAKPAERRTNGASASGRPRRLGRPREKLPHAGDVQTDTAGLRAKDNLRGKRRDPWPWSTHRQKRWPPNAKWSRRGGDRSRVLSWFASRWRNHQPKRAEKPHSIIRCRKASDGPATRPKTPLAVENGVGKPAAPLRRERLMSARERERGALPPPNLSLFGRKAGQGHFLSLEPASVQHLGSPGPEPPFARRVRSGSFRPGFSDPRDWNGFRSAERCACRPQENGWFARGAPNRSNHAVLFQAAQAR